MRKTLIALAALVAMASASAAQTLKVTVNGMVCAFCAQGIEKRLSKLDAAEAVFVDLKNKVVAVQAKEGKTLDEKKIKDEIVDAGYDVVKIEPVSQSVDEIRGQAKEAP